MGNVHAGKSKQGAHRNDEHLHQYIPFIQMIATNDYSIPPAFTDRGHLIVRLYIEALYLKALKKPPICENRTFGLQNNVIHVVSPENRGD